MRTQDHVTERTHRIMSQRGLTGSRHREDSEGMEKVAIEKLGGTPWAETFLGGHAGRENSGNTCVVTQKARVTAVEGGAGEAGRK